MAKSSGWETVVVMVLGTEIRQHRTLHRRQGMEIGAALVFSITEVIELPDLLLAVQ